MGTLIVSALFMAFFVAVHLFLSLAFGIPAGIFAFGMMVGMVTALAMRRERAPNALLIPVIVGALLSAFHGVQQEWVSYGLGVMIGLWLAPSRKEAT